MMMKMYDILAFKTLLANTLRERPDGYVVREIFTRFSSIQELLEVTEEELMSIKGIGKIKAQQIISALKLACMMPMPTEHSYTIRSPHDAYEYLKDMQYLTQENFVVIGLNTKNQVTFRETIFIGSLNSSIVHPREVFKPLIKKSCASGIVAHQHPSGNPEPSREDLEVTKRLVECGRIIGIDILDHIVIGHQRFISLKEKGLM
jgi:DNA repair protein RadC